MSFASFSSLFLVIRPSRFAILYQLRRCVRAATALLYRMRRTVCLVLLDSGLRSDALALLLSYANVFAGCQVRRQVTSEIDICVASSSRFW